MVNEEEDFTTIKIRRSALRKIEAMKVHEKQPIYEIIDKLLEEQAWKK